MDEPSRILAVVARRRRAVLPCPALGPLAPPLHETHVCRDCGAEITLPYAKPDELLEGYWEKAYWRIVPKLAEALVLRRPRPSGSS